MFSEPNDFEPIFVCHGFLIVCHCISATKKINVSIWDKCTINRLTGFMLSQEYTRARSLQFATHRAPNESGIPTIRLDAVRSGIERRGIPLLARSRLRLRLRLSRLLLLLLSILRVVLLLALLLLSLDWPLLLLLLLRSLPILLWRLPRLVLLFASRFRPLLLLRVL